MITAVFIIQLLTIGLLLWHIRNGRLSRFEVDISQVASLIAAAIMRDWASELHALEREGTLQYIGERYLQLCADIGLPTSAVDVVKRLAWERIAQARGIEGPTQTAVKEFALYE